MYRLCGNQLSAIWSWYSPISPHSHYQIGTTCRVSKSSTCWPGRGSNPQPRNHTITIRLPYPHSRHTMLHRIFVSRFCFCPSVVGQTLFRARNQFVDWWNGIWKGWISNSNTFINSFHCDKQQTLQTLQLERNNEYYYTCKKFAPISDSILFSVAAQEVTSPRDHEAT